MRMTRETQIGFMISSRLKLPLQGFGEMRYHAGNDHQSSDMSCRLWIGERSGRVWNV